MIEQRPKKISKAKITFTVISVLSIPPILYFYFQVIFDSLLNKKINETGATLITILILLVLVLSTISLLVIRKNRKIEKYVDEYGVPIQIGFIDVKKDF